MGRTKAIVTVRLNEVTFGKTSGGLVGVVWDRRHCSGSIPHKPMDIRMPIEFEFLVNCTFKKDSKIVVKAKYLSIKVVVNETGKDRAVAGWRVDLGVVARGQGIREEFALAQRTVKYGEVGMRLTVMLGAGPPAMALTTNAASIAASPPPAEDVSFVRSRSGDPAVVRQATRRLSTVGGSPRGSLMLTDEDRELVTRVRAKMRGVPPPDDVRAGLRFGDEIVEIMEESPRGTNFAVVGPHIARLGEGNGFGQLAALTRVVVGMSEAGMATWDDVLDPRLSSMLNAVITRVSDGPNLAGCLRVFEVGEMGRYIGSIVLLGVARHRHTPVANLATQAKWPLPAELDTAGDRRLVDLLRDAPYDELSGGAAKGK